MSSTTPRTTWSRRPAASSSPNRGAAPRHRYVMPRAAGGSALPRSEPSREQQDEDDDQDDADDADTSMTVAVAVAAEPATEAAKQEDDEDDDKYKSHGRSPVAAPDEKSSLFAL